ncbi:MAG: OsmC family protein [Sandaracinaceae bacterium]|jgi:putative redox protein|nr:OsmC family protein [Sandaracinaceae bacterium]MBK7775837.1 OsmC family protein [Sandaracinaceae bacterium]MBK8409275.1 OsmC family protein [Sandaracinaceae bacterium]MBK8592723.1 OsmC family protein [Sandaracinaceae bacterium]MBP7681062.1 OsmC family protein [Deltaproteobacteria bacterium]
MKAIATAGVTSSSVAYRQDIRTGNHTLVADEPPDHGGQDAGPAPYDLLLAALGSCTAITLEMYAAKKGWRLGQLRVDLTFFKNREGESRIERVLHVTEPLDEEQWARLIDVAGKTPVTKTLLSGTPITTTAG